MFDLFDFSDAMAGEIWEVDVHLADTAESSDAMHLAFDTVPDGYGLFEHLGTNSGTESLLTLTASSDGDPATESLDSSTADIYPRGTLSPEEFQRDGTYDPKHNCVVEGSVLSDLLLVDKQTTGSCSLMAQEQFVERWRGQSVSEAELISLAWDQGVYGQGVFGWVNGGTNFAGLDLALDAYDVPHRRINSCDVNQLEHFLKNGCDGLVRVDASSFYNDPACGPDSCHAIAVVGRGKDYWTGNTTGFYVTDSNFPGTARFLSVQEFEACWHGDLIAVPASPETNPSVLFA